MTSVTRAELAVLRILWSRGPTSIRLLAGELYDGDGPSGHATVQKLLDRLTEKGFVSREKDGRSYLYRHVVGRGELVARRLRETAETLCGGSMSPLITHLVSSEELTAADIARLRELVDALGSEQGSGEP